jgi:hypothetical protein
MCLPIVDTIKTSLDDSAITSRCVVIIHSIASTCSHIYAEDYFSDLSTILLEVFKRNNIDENVCHLIFMLLSDIFSRNQDQILVLVSDKDTLWSVCNSIVNFKKSNVILKDISLDISYCTALEIVRAYDCWA